MRRLKVKYTPLRKTKVSNRVLLQVPVPSANTEVSFAKNAIKEVNIPHTALKTMQLAKNLPTAKNNAITNVTHLAGFSKMGPVALFFPLEKTAAQLSAEASTKTRQDQ